MSDTDGLKEIISDALGPIGIGKAIVLHREIDRWSAAHDAAVRAATLREAADEFETTTHAWGKLAMINVLRARAAAALPPENQEAGQ